ncbi:hypothetical protein [uncultured Ruminococcus sp.]|uniref:hypothetical protein n=1 Tax=uncultured Ruminococcus sp. TaxID=165186 RepID=UPI0026655DF8|nr:hypothetical protein [uncultured Ruminococcus sp.]
MLFVVASKNVLLTTVVCVVSSAFLLSSLFFLQPVKQPQSNESDSKKRMPFLFRIMIPPNNRCVQILLAFWYPDIQAILADKMCRIYDREIAALVGREHLFLRCQQSKL